MRRALRWVGIAGLVALVVVLVLPFLLRFESSGTLTPQQAAQASLGEEPTFVTLEGVETYVERVAADDDVVADGEVPLIVVLHGFGASAATWRAVLPALADHGEVVAYDRPPFGFTQRPAADEGGDEDPGDAADEGGDEDPGGAGETADAPVDPYGSEGQIALLGAVIDTFRGGDSDRPVVLLGHSAGGTLAAEYALRRPDDVDALVLVAPAVLTTGGAPGWVQPVLGFPSIDRWGPWLARAAARGADGLLERSWHDPSRLTDDVRARYDEPQQVAGWEQGLWQLVRAPAQLRVSDDASMLDLPVLLITGDDDRVVPTDDTRQLAELIDGAQLAVLDATGHVPHEESPVAFLDAVGDGWPLVPSG